jgi:hypothetical protein
LAGKIRRRYLLEESADLSSPNNWKLNRNIVLTNASQTVLDLSPADSNERFYRARALP